MTKTLEQELEETFRLPSMLLIHWFSWLDTQNAEHLSRLDNIIMNHRNEAITSTSPFIRKRIQYLLRKEKSIGQ